MPLREVARIEKAVGKAAITREANSRVLALKFNVEGRDLGSVVTEALRRSKRDVKVPEGNYLVWGGEFENQKRALGAAGGDRAVLVPGRVRAAVHGARLGRAAPLSVLLVAPLAMSGGVFGLAAAAHSAVGQRGRRLHRAARPGVPGVAARRQRGRTAPPRGRGAAARRSSAGAASRFRTVLMTALLAILGLMPAALSSGVGSETQRPFAVVIISGLVTAVAVTLFVLPFAYSLIAPQPPAAVTESESEQ